MELKQILVIQNKRIGDVLISSVIANNIKKVFPKSHVTYFVYDYTVGVLENNPDIDRIISVQEKVLKKPVELFKMMRYIRAQKYAIIFDPYSKLQSRLMCLYSGAPIRIGQKRAHKKLKLPFYTHPISYLKQRSKNCGKAIEDKINMITSVFDLPNPTYKPKIFLTEKETQYAPTKELTKPIVMLGVLGSTPKKSMPYPYIVALIDFITKTYKATILFNYAPHQKQAAQEIYNMCADKQYINMDIYEDSIRGFICLMNSCDVLVANEGGSVHITKALHIPTFTIYSPYINKESWCSFEDKDAHDSIHLLEEQPDLFKSFTQEQTRKIEKNPSMLYQKLTPKMILKKLNPFLQKHLSQ